MSNKQKAEQIFREQFDKALPISKSSDSKKFFDEWKIDNQYEYNSVIIPSIVQALEMKDEIKFGVMKAGEPGAGGYDLNNLPVSEKHLNDAMRYIQNPTIKDSLRVQPGQKLKDGDWFEGGTVDQYKELLEIEGHNHPIGINNVTKLYFMIGHIVFSDPFLDSTEHKETRYSFPDFKQLCENTFGDV